MQHEEHVCNRPKKSTGSSNAASVNSVSNNTNTVSEQKMLPVTGTEGAHTIRPKCRRCREICESFKHVLEISLENHDRCRIIVHCKVIRGLKIMNLPTWETIKMKTMRIKIRHTNSFKNNNKRM